MIRSQLETEARLRAPSDAVPPRPARASASSSSHWIATLVVVGVSIAMLALAHDYVRRFASPIPFMDDLDFAPYAVPGSRPSWPWLWSLANEHRLPLPRLVYVGLLRVTGDFRSGMYFQVYALAALALAMILVARRLRGRTTVADAFFPLVLLHTGNGENYLLGMQIAVVCSASIPSAIVLCALARRDVHQVHHVPHVHRGVVPLAIATGLVAMPLTGAAGIAQLPPLALWALLVPFAGRQHRRTALVLAGGATLALVLCALYFVDFRSAELATGTPGVRALLATGSKFLSLALGPAARPWWPASGAFVVGLALATIVLLARVAWREPAERARATVLLAHVLGLFLLAAAVGSGRGNLSWGAGFTDRYTIGPAPLLCSLFLAWCAYGPRWSGRLVELALCVVLVAALPENVRRGEHVGPRRHAAARALAADVDAGVPVPDLAQRHWEAFFPDRARFELLLRSLEHGGLAPFPPR